jgi:hypothetical protein
MSPTHFHTVITLQYIHQPREKVRKIDSV